VYAEYAPGMDTGSGYRWINGYEDTGDNGGSGNEDTGVNEGNGYEDTPTADGPDQQQANGAESEDAIAASAVGAPTANARPPMVDENNVYDMQVPGKKSKGAAAATAARIAREGGGEGAGAGGHAALTMCTRPSPAGGTCKNNALLGGAGLFCVVHTCPECGAGKSGSAPGCPAHLTRLDESVEDFDAVC
jgi:hypothetical protein